MTRLWARPALVAIIAIIVVGAVLRAAAIGGERRVSRDEFGNGVNANAILRGKAYRTLRWAPGTPFVLAAATTVAGSSTLALKPRSTGPAQYAQLVIEVATLVLIAVIAWTTAGQGAALLAVALAALYIPLILITRTFLGEPLGGLMILATFAAAAWARRRGPLALAAAGVIAGLGCLTREDLVPAVVVIAVAIAGALWSSSRRNAVLHSLVYVACAAAVVAPWTLYASRLDGRLVPITDGGADALFIGTYLPGGGELYGDTQHFKTAVCAKYPKDCPHYASNGASTMLKLVASRYPRLSHNAALTRADIENIRRYALGRPLAFAGMLAGKLWRMWGTPWSGDNGFGRHPSTDTSPAQHLLFVGLAWIGLLAGAVITRRWSLIVAAAGLVVITALNVLVNAQGRDNLRLMPLLITFGASGLLLSSQELRQRLRQRQPRALQVDVRDPEASF